MFRARIALGALTAFVSLAPSTPAGAGGYPGVNGKVVYVAGDDIFSVNPDGTEVKNVTQIEGLDAQSIAASPDGKRIAYNVGRDSLYDDAGLYLTDMRGTMFRNVLLGHEDDFVSVGAPTWSPDGRRIAFEAYTSGLRNELFVVDTNGIHLRKLTSCDCVSSSYPVWSPVGPEIAFVPCCSQVVRTVNVDTRETAEVFESQSGDVRNLTWSPDGEQLAYDDLLDVYRVAVPDGTPVALTSNGAASYSDPAWSPDGTKIVLQSNHDSPESTGRDIYAIDAAEGIAAGAERITTAPEAEGRPEWAPLCESRCTPTTLHLGKIAKTRSTVTVKGSISPEGTGQVTLTLLRKTPAGLRPIGGSKQVTVSGERAQFTAKFSRPSSDLCKIRARYGGDADHEGSFAVRSFAC